MRSSLELDGSGAARTTSVRAEGDSLKTEEKTRTPTPVHLERSKNLYPDAHESTNRQCTNWEWQAAARRLSC